MPVAPRTTASAPWRGRGPERPGRQGSRRGRRVERRRPRGSRRCRDAPACHLLPPVGSITSALASTAPRSARWSALRRSDPHATPRRRVPAAPPPHLRHHEAGQRVQDGFERDLHVDRFVQEEFGERSPRPARCGDGQQEPPSRNRAPTSNGPAGARKRGDARVHPAFRGASRPRDPPPERVDRSRSHGSPPGTGRAARDRARPARAAAARHRATAAPGRCPALGVDPRHTRGRGQPVPQDGSGPDVPPGGAEPAPTGLGRGSGTRGGGAGTAGRGARRRCSPNGRWHTSPSAPGCPAVGTGLHWVMATSAPTSLPNPTRGPVLWRPRHVLVTASAQAEPHGQAILERLAADGVDDVRLLSGDRLPPLRGKDEPRDVRPREAHARRRHERRVEASADPHPAERRLLLPARRGLPGPLPVLLPRRVARGPPITRVYADLPRILAGLDEVVGTGGVTSGTEARVTRGRRSRPPATPIRWRWNTSRVPSPRRSPTSGRTTGRVPCSCA